MPKLDLSAKGGLAGWTVVALAAGFYCVVLGFALSFGKTLGQSVDMGFHLQTAELLADHFIVPKSAESFQAEMFAYPRWSYRLTTPLMWAGLSSPNALGLVATASIAAVWLMLLSAARAISRELFLAAFLCAATTVVFLGATFGAEVISNYFYPQMVAEPVSVGLILVGAYLVQRSRAAFALFALAAVWICGQFHLIAAMRVAGGLGVVLLLELARAPAARRLATAAWLAVLPAMAAVLLLSPTFAAMRRLSVVNGGIVFARPLEIWQLELAALALLALCACIAVQLLRRAGPADWKTPALAFFAAFGAATAAAALAQAAAFAWLGEASPYAVKKHAFGVFTALAFVGPICAGLVLGALPQAVRRRGRLPLGLLLAAGLAATAFVLVRRMIQLYGGGLAAMIPFDQIRYGLAGLAVLGLGLAAIETLRRTLRGGRAPRPIKLAVLMAAHLAVLQLLLLRPGGFEVSHLSGLLQDTAALKAETRGPPGTYFFASSRSPLDSFLVNMAALQLDRRSDQNYAAMLYATDVVNPELAPNMITEVGDPTYDQPGCRRGPPHGWVVMVRGACVPQAFYDFGTGQSGTALLGEGWSASERDLTWSDGPRAVIDLPLPASMRGAPDPRLIIHAAGYVTPQSPRRVVHAVVEGGAPQTYPFDARISADFTFRLSIPPAAVKRGMARVVFTIDEPIRADPAVPRRLGVAIWRMVLYPKVEGAAGR